MNLTDLPSWAPATTADWTSALNAIKVIMALQERIWGGFYKPFPDFGDMTPEQIRTVFSERVLEITGFFERNEVCIGAVTRLAQELCITRILLLLAEWAVLGETAPITAQTLSDIQDNMLDSCTAGVDSLSIENVLTYLLIIGGARELS